MNNLNCLFHIHDIGRVSIFPVTQFSKLGNDNVRAPFVVVVVAVFQVTAFFLHNNISIIYTCTMSMCYL